MANKAFTRQKKEQTRRQRAQNTAEAKEPFVAPNSKRVEDEITRMYRPNSEGDSAPTAKPNFTKQNTTQYCLKNNNRLAANAPRDEIAEM